MNGANILNWIDQAACGGGPKPNQFHPDAGKLNQQDTARTVSVCQKACPVRDACLEWALVNDMTDGIWGGLTPRERQHLKRRKAS